MSLRGVLPDPPSLEQSILSSWCPLQHPSANAPQRTESRAALRRPKRKRMWLRLGGTAVSMAGETQQVIRCPAEAKGQQAKQGQSLGPQMNAGAIV